MIVGFIPFKHSQYRKQDLTITPKLTDLQYITGNPDLDAKITRYEMTRIEIKDSKENKIIYSQWVTEPIEIKTKCEFFDTAIRLLVNGKEVYKDIFGTFFVNVKNGNTTKHTYIYDDFHSGQDIDQVYPNRWLT